MPPTTGDYRLLSGVLLLAFLLTAYPTLSAVSMLMSGVSTPMWDDTVRVLIVVSFWNFWIWGLPIIAALERWHEGVKTGVDEHYYLVRVFARAQLLTVGLPVSALFVLLPMMISLLILR